jgi:hypothetical protein
MTISNNMCRRRRKKSRQQIEIFVIYLI